MMHTNKMILVPHDIGHRDDAAASVMSNLDREMNEILQNKSLPSDAKVIMYNQVLHRHRQATQEQTKPFELKVVEPITAPEPKTLDNVEKTPEKDPLYQKTMKIIPKKYQTQADMLYSYAMDNPHMEWSDKGEMIINGNKIAGSNITDLVSDIARIGSKRQPALGADLFVKNLLKENIPRDLIVNKSRLNFGSDSGDVYASPSGPIESKKVKTPKGGRGLARWLEL